MSWLTITNKTILPKPSSTLFTPLASLVLNLCQVLYVSVVYFFIDLYCVVVFQIVHIFNTYIIVPVCSVTVLSTMTIKAILLPSGLF